MLYSTSFDSVDSWLLTAAFCYLDPCTDIQLSEFPEKTLPTEVQAGTFNFLIGQRLKWLWVHTRQFRQFRNLLEAWWRCWTSAYENASKQQKTLIRWKKSDYISNWLVLEFDIWFFNETSGGIWKRVFVTRLYSIVRKM